jgi:hypothetical protein
MLLVVTGKRKIIKPIESEIKIELDSKIPRKLILSNPDSNIIVNNSNSESKPEDKLPATKPNTEYYHNTNTQIPEGFINDNVTTLYVYGNDKVKLNRKNVPLTVKTIILDNYRKEKFEQELLDNLDTFYIHHIYAYKFWSNNKSYLSKLNINFGVFSYGKNRNFKNEKSFGIKLDKSQIYNKYVGSIYNDAYITILPIIKKSGSNTVIKPSNNEHVINSSIVELKMESHKNNETNLSHDKNDEIFCANFNNLAKSIKNKKLRIEEDKNNIVIAINDAIEKNYSNTRIKINSNPNIVDMVIDKIKNIPDNNYIIEYKIDIIEDDIYCDFDLKMNI